MQEYQDSESTLNELWNLYQGSPRVIWSFGAKCVTQQLYDIICIFDDIMQKEGYSLIEDKDEAIYCSDSFYFFIVNEVDRAIMNIQKWLFACANFNNYDNKKGNYYC